MPRVCTEPMKIASFNINNINRLATCSELASRSRARHRVPSGTQGRRRGLSSGSNPGGGFSCGVTRREALERRGDPRAMGACADLRGVFRRRARRAMSLYLEAAVNGVGPGYWRHQRWTMDWVSFVPRPKHSAGNGRAMTSVTAAIPRSASFQSATSAGAVVSVASA